jgi:hypothetical protein
MSLKASKSRSHNKGQQAACQVLALGPILKKYKTDDSEIDKFQAKVAAGQKTLEAALELRLRQT